MHTAKAVVEAPFIKQLSSTDSELKKMCLL